MKPFRQERLRAAIAESGVCALVASTPENLYYVTEHWSIINSESRSGVALAIVGADGAVAGLVTSCGEVANFVDAGFDPERIWTFGRFFFEGGAAARAIQAAVARAAPSSGEALAGALEALGLAHGRIGLDEGQIPLAVWQALPSLLPGVDIVPAQKVFKKARRVKGPDELALLERAAEIAENSVLAAVASAAPGITEREVARRFEAEVIAQGGRLPPAYPVITFGERAAFSDTLPTDRTLRRGDVIRMDLVATYGGYRADIARTALCGDADPRYAVYYEAMRAGADAAMAAIRPGLPAARLFDIAMETVHARGVPHYRRQHVGHAIGLEVYDEFAVAPSTEMPLESDMVLCIETPYYEIGWGGVQIEDLVRVTPNGAVRLNKTSRDLLHVPA